MSLDWMPRDNEPKDHLLHTDAHWGTDADAPCVVYEKRPLTDPKGKVQEGLYVAWIRLNNPKQYNGGRVYRHRPLFFLYRRQHQRIQ
jgi:6-oxo-cyclohex-1-ene-carbonyl-CoA hydrolase